VIRFLLRGLNRPQEIEAVFDVLDAAGEAGPLLREAADLAGMPERRGERPLGRRMQPILLLGRDPAGLAMLAAGMPVRTTVP
jgi:hypothetical protein